MYSATESHPTVLFTYEFCSRASLSYQESLKYALSALNFRSSCPSLWSSCGYRPVPPNLAYKVVLPFKMPVGPDRGWEDTEVACS